MDKYYQLLDRDPSTISPMWKAGHILCFAVVILSGFIAAYALGSAAEYFGHNCVLFASISFLNTNSTPKPAEVSPFLLLLPRDSLRPFNMSYTQWGSIKLCSFCQFTPLCSAIFGFVWCVLFIICSRGGAGYITDAIYRPWRMVYPVLVYNLISTGVMLGSLQHLSNGIKHFCAQFEPIFNTTSCTHSIDVYTLSFSTYQKPLITALEIGLASTYICFFAGFIHLCIILFRIVCIVDFQMIRITVTSYKPHTTTDTSPDVSVDELHFGSVGIGTSFAFPVHSREKNLSPSTSFVPMAESESLTDVLAHSPRNNKQKNGAFVSATSICNSLDTGNNKTEVLVDIPTSENISKKE